MPGDRISETDHVSRHFGKSRCDDDGRPLGTAFLPRPNELYLSVNWLEHTGYSSRSEQLREVCTQLANGGMSVRASTRLAVLHLDSLFSHVRSNSLDMRELCAHHEPILPQNPSHSGIYGYTVDDHLIADLMAEAVEEVHKAHR